MGLLDQDATAGRLMMGPSSIGAMVSSVMYLARWTARSSFCPKSSAPTRREMVASLGSEGLTATGPKECPNADDIGVEFYLAVQALDGVGGMQLARCSLGKVI